MIEVISNWAGELVVSLIIVTIIEMLLPENKIKKYVKTVIGVYIIFCIISPFIDKEEFATILKETEKSLEKIKIESQVSSNLEENSSIESLYIQEFEKDVIKRVEELGYEVKQCSVQIEINASKDNAGINEIYLNIGNKKFEDIQSANIEIEDIEKVEISIKNQNTGNNKSEETAATKEVKMFLRNYYGISQEKIKVTQN